MSSRRFLPLKGQPKLSRTQALRIAEAACLEQGLNAEELVRVSVGLRVWVVTYGSKHRVNRVNRVVVDRVTGEVATVEVLDLLGCFTVVADDRIR